VAQLQPLLGGVEGGHNRVVRSSGKEAGGRGSQRMVAWAVRATYALDLTLAPWPESRIKRGNLMK